MQENHNPHPQKQNGNPDPKLKLYSDNIENLIDSMRELKNNISTGKLVDKNQIANTQTISMVASKIIDEKSENLRNQIDALFTTYKTSLKEDVVNEIRGKNNQSGILPKVKKARFSEKQFQEKDSLLTEMQKNSDFKTILNIILAMLAVLTMYILIQQFYQTGNFNINFTLITWSFGKANIVVKAWGIMTLICCVVPVVLVKATDQFRLTKCFFIPFAVVIHLTIYIIGIYTCFSYKLPPASAIALSCESARMSMKTHAYIRDKLMFGRQYNKKAREYSEYMPGYCKKAGVTVEDLNLPKISIESIYVELKRMAYFFLVPSLIYRDKYLRSKHIRLIYVLNNILGCLFSLMMTFVIFKVISIPKFKQMENERLTLRTFLSNCMLQSLSGTLILVTGFFGILHSWLSLMAELTRFADRRFYEDWWNVDGFEMYYRKWNIVVHEFLYYYVYKDCQRFTNGKMGPNSAKMFVFFVSVIFHEVVTTCMQGFFFPVMGLLFGGPGILFTKLKRSTGKQNLAFWILMMIGNGVILVLGSTEWYGRHNPNYNITLKKDGLLAVLTPVSIFGS